MDFKDPFPIEDVEYRIGATTQQGDKSMLLFYVDARAVMDRLDECSAAWRDEYVLHPDGKHVECRLTVTVDGVESTHADVGEPSEGLGDPLKGAYSDALKRAAVKFGIGRYLYSLGETWVPVETGNNGKPRIGSAGHEAARNYYANKINGTVPQQAPRAQVPQLAPPSCPDHGVCRYVPAGTSKASGKDYEAFYSCRDKDCKRGSQGKGFYVNAGDWAQNTKNLNQPSTETADPDDLPQE